MPSHLPKKSDPLNPLNLSPFAGMRQTELKGASPRGNLPISNCAAAHRSLVESLTPEQRSALYVFSAPKWSILLGLFMIYTPGTHLRAESAACTMPRGKHCQSYKGAEITPNASVLDENVMQKRPNNRKYVAQSNVYILALDRSSLTDDLWLLQLRGGDRKRASNDGRSDPAGLCTVSGLQV